MKIIFIDVMLGGHFYKQLSYEYCPLWKLNLSELKDYVLERMPWLKREKYTLELSTQKI